MAVTCEFDSLSKRFGVVDAVEAVSFTVQPRRVTGFLGPNGAGKTTSLRCLLGLVRPTSGAALVDGRAYADLAEPLRTVGAVLESSNYHPGRSARGHLTYLALAAGLPGSRVAEVLRLVGMTEYADRRMGGYSLGMRQRIGIAQALLGDPAVLVLDEPANGLDPAGIAWLRGLLRQLAAEGRTVLVSSHVLTEVQQTVDDIVVLNRGRLVAAGELAGLKAAQSSVLVRSPDRDRLHDVVGGELVEADGVRVHGSGVAEIGHTAFVAGIELHQLAEEPADLERFFLEMTGPDAASTGARETG